MASFERLKVSVITIGYIGDAAVPLAAAKEPDVRLTFPFTFSVQAMSAVRDALKFAQGRGPKSPRGEVRARADLVPR